jgi:flagellar secretion chaperone FliS
VKRTNPWNSYRQVATQTASPGQLVLMLYDGAIRFLELARKGFEEEDPARFAETISNNVLRAQDIIRELDASLDLRQGGEFAANMRRLYDYVDRRLHESNLAKQPDGIQDAIRRLTILRDAWEAMLRNQHSPPPDGAPQAMELAAA